MKITHSKKNIGIGVVDYAKQKDQRFSHVSGNAMCYFSNGQQYPEFIKEGDGFKQGDIVSVEVDRSAKTVKYFINNIHKVTQKNEILGDINRVFMPFVEMIWKSDSVEWLL